MTQLEILDEIKRLFDLLESQMDKETDAFFFSAMVTVDEGKVVGETSMAGRPISVGVSLMDSCYKSEDVLALLGASVNTYPMFEAQQDALKTLNN